MPRFFARSCPQALVAIATVAKGAAPAIERSFIGIAPLQSARPEHVSYCAELGKCTLEWVSGLGSAACTPPSPMVH